MIRKTIKFVFIAGSIAMVMHMAYQKYRDLMRPSLLQEAIVYRSQLNQFEKAITQAADQDQIDSLNALLRPLLIDGLQIENQDQIRYLHLLSVLYLNNGNEELAQEQLNRAMSLIEIANTETEQQVVFDLYTLYYKNGNSHDLFELVDEQIRKAEESNEKGFLIDLITDKGYAIAHFESVQESLEYFEQAKSLALEENDMSRIVSCDINFLRLDTTISTHDRLNQLLNYEENANQLTPDTKWRLYATISDVYYFGLENFQNSYKYLKLQYETVIQIESSVTRKKHMAATLTNLADAAHVLNLEADAKMWLDSAFVYQDNMDFIWIPYLYDNYANIYNLNQQETLQKYSEFADYCSAKFGEFANQQGRLFSSQLALEQELRIKEVEHQAAMRHQERKGWLLIFIILGLLVAYVLKGSRSQRKDYAVRHKLVTQGNAFFNGTISLSIYHDLISRISYEISPAFSNGNTVFNYFIQEAHYYRSVWEKPYIPVHEELQVISRFMATILTDDSYKGIHIELNCDQSLDQTSALVPRYLLKSFVVLIVSSAYFSRANHILINITKRGNKLAISSVFPNSINLYPHYLSTLNDTLVSLGAKPISHIEMDRGSHTEMEIPFRQ